MTGRPAVPRLLLLTDRRRSEAAGRGLVDTVAAAVEAGVRAVLLREKDLDAQPRRRLATELAGVLAPTGAALFVAGDAALASAVGAAGVHLAASDPPVTQGGLVVGRSCHDENEVRAAVAEGVDYVTVSPVAATASKPGYGPALGHDGLRRLVAPAAGVPVLALGGVTARDVPAWCAAGAHGVAVMGAVMGAADPAATVRELLERLPEGP
jgi:thiamine-phosphate pyrophosphorylase